MFEISQRYLAAHYDAETGETTGSSALLQVFLRYQKMRWWWYWHKEQPSVTSIQRAISHMARVAATKTTF